MIDAHLAAAGLGREVRRRPGLRMPGAFDGFEAAVLELAGAGTEALGKVVAAASDAMETGSPRLTRVALAPARVAALGVAGLLQLGLPPARAEALAAVASSVAARSLRLEPGAEPLETLRRLRDVAGLERPMAEAVVLRSLRWPDAFCAVDPELRASAERWRPWRAYAEAHLRLSNQASSAAGADQGRGVPAPVES
jgi:AraC family transcriptional regulator of adaptative response / DNA-3-methyladenine glycosylase II